MTEEKPVVYVVDDDPSVRKALERSLSSAGHEPKTFASADEFLDFDLFLQACFAKIRGVETELPEPGEPLKNGQARLRVVHPDGVVGQFSQETQPLDSHPLSHSQEQSVQSAHVSLREQTNP